MNGLLLPSGQQILTANGLLPAHSPLPNDLWGQPDVIERYLGDMEGAFIRREYDRITAHVTTSLGRVFVHRIDTDPWQPLRNTNARHTLRMMDSLARELKVKALHYSPQSRGLSIVDFSRTEHPEWFERDLPEDWDLRDGGVTPNFTRRIDDPKQIGWYLHKYDMRAAWAAAARTAQMGYGEVRRVMEFDPARPGIWPVKPNTLIANPQPIMHAGWYSTEIVRAAKNAGLNIGVGPGWCWSEQSTPLRSFIERLFRARDGALHPAYTEDESAWLQDSIKRIYTRTQGALDSYKQSRPKLFQPHWYYTLRAESARRVWKLYDLTAYSIGIDTDTVYCVAPADISPADIFPGSSPTAWQPGKLRYEGYTPLTRELYDMLGCPASEISQYIRQRNCLEPWGE